MKAPQSTNLSLLLVGLLAGLACALPAEPTGSQSSLESSHYATTLSTGSRQTRDASGNKKKKGGANKKDGSFKKECVSAHNNWRRMHGAQELKLDAELTEYAQARADYIAASDGDKFEHIRDNPYGENLAWHTDLGSSCTKLAKMWYDEESLYDYSRPVFELATGHFTQMAWRDTRRVGCAKQTSSGRQGGVYLVCVYDPPGNFQGEFTDNVLPAKSTKSESSSTKPPATTTTTTTSTARAITTTEANLTSPSGQPEAELASNLKPSVSSLDANVEKPTSKPKPKKKKNKNKNKKNKRKSGNKKNKNKKRKQQSNSTTTEAPARSVVTTTPVGPAPN